LLEDADRVGLKGRHAGEVSKEEGGRHKYKRLDESGPAVGLQVALENFHPGHVSGVCCKFVGLGGLEENIIFFLNITWSNL
jgi:hypothetical protein